MLRLPRINADSAELVSALSHGIKIAFKAHNTLALRLLALQDILCRFEFQFRDRIFADIAASSSLTLDYQAI